MSTVETPTKPTVATHPGVQPEHHARLPRKATAAGATDAYCHWYLNRSRTLCGITHEPLDNSQFHRDAPCPNGNPPCPACVTAYSNGGQL